MEPTKPQSSRRKLIIIGVVLVALVAAGVYGASLFGYNLFEKKTTSSWEPMTITQENVASVMSRTNLVKDIPADGVIALYIGEKAYTLTHASMRAGAPSNADVVLRIPDSYLVTMGQYGPCAAISRAHQNREISIELGESSTAIAWKYKSLAKYRACLE